MAIVLLKNSNRFARVCDTDIACVEKSFVQSPNDEWTASDDDIALFEFPALVETLDDREIGSDDDIILA